MFTQIQGNDKVFESVPFLSEEVRFNLIHRIRESENPLLLSNEKRNIIIGQSSYKFPAWVWTCEGLAQEDLTELCDAFTEAFKDAPKLSFVAKPEIASQLAERYSKARGVDYYVKLEMMSHHCPDLILPIPVSGYLEKAKESDLYVAAEFIAGFDYECFCKDKKIDKCLKKAEELIDTGNLYFWKDKGENVSMAFISHRSPKYAKINEVYTRPDMRNKGYAANIVFKLCEIVKNEGLTPVLYTDIKNPASNKAYKNIGFVECGELVEIKFKIKDRAEE